MDPSTQNALEIVGACLPPGNQACPEALAGAVSSVPDWESLWRFACERHVASLLYARLRSVGLLASIPDEIRHRFHMLYLQTAAANALRLHQMLKVSSLLNQWGVKTLYLKGTSLVMAGDYPDAGHRMFADVDVLVDQAHQNQVRRAFAEAEGWRELPPTSERDYKDSRWFNSWGTLVEVHWQLHSFNSVPSRVGEQRLWAQAQAVSYRGNPVWIPSPEDRFIIAAIHGTARHSFDSSLLFVAVADLAHLAGKPGVSLDWDRITTALQEERMLEHAAVAVELAWELTRFEPLARGLAAFRDREPKLQAVTAPLVRPLLRMVRKPWVFASMAESKLLTDRRLLVRTRILAYALLDKLFPGARKPLFPPTEGIEVKLVNMDARYQRKLLDRDFLSYLFQLSRFYRRIGYTGMN